MNSEVAWVLVSLGSQVQPQIILDPDYLPEYLSVSCDYAQINFSVCKPLSYCLEETIGFDEKASFASRPLSRLIR